MDLFGGGLTSFQVLFSMSEFISELTASIHSAESSLPLMSPNDSGISSTYDSAFNAKAIAAFPSSSS